MACGTCCRAEHISQPIAAGRGSPSTILDAEIDQIVASYERGESLARITQRLGVAHTIQATLHRRGISRRDNHGRTQ